MIKFVHLNQIQLNHSLNHISIFNFLRIEMFTRVKAHLENFFIMAGRVRARNSLLELNDRLLEDISVSRELLNQGISAWPWRIESAEIHALKPAEQICATDNIEYIAENVSPELDEEHKNNHPIAA